MNPHTLRRLSFGSTCATFLRQHRRQIPIDSTLKSQLAHSAAHYVHQTREDHGMHMTAQVKRINLRNTRRTNILKHAFCSLVQPIAFISQAAVRAAESVAARLIIVLSKQGTFSS